MSTPVKILYVINNSDIGGGPQHLGHLLRYLDFARIHAEVACTAGGIFETLFTQRNTKVIPVDVMCWYRLPWSLMCLVRAIRSGEIELVHAHGTRAGFIGVLAARLSNIPCIYTLHATRANRDDRFGAAWFYGLIERFICHASSFVISVCEANRKYAISHLRLAVEHIETIPNGLPLEEWQAQPHGPEFSGIGFIGRLDRQKGVLLFIEAAAVVHEIQDHIPFVIIGDGIWRDRAQARVRKLGLEEVVRFVGWIPDSIRAYSLFTVLALPSLWEGMPYVLLEGMALGKPVVGADVNGISEVIRDGDNGIVVPRNNPSALAHAILDLAAHPDLAGRYATKASAHVHQHHGAVEMAARTMEVYERILIRDRNLP